MSATTCCTPPPALLVCNSHWRDPRATAHSLSGLMARATHMSEGAWQGRTREPDDSSSVFCSQDSSRRTENCTIVTARNRHAAKLLHQHISAHESQATEPVAETVSHNSQGSMQQQLLALRRRLTCRAGKAYITPKDALYFRRPHRQPVCQPGAMPSNLIAFTSSGLHRRGRPPLV